MQLHYVPAAGPPMQSVYVLGEEDEGGNMAFQLGERLVAGVGGSFPHQLAAPGVPLPDEAWVSVERLGGG